MQTHTFFTAFYITVSYSGDGFYEFYRISETFHRFLPNEYFLGIFQTIISSYFNQTFPIFLVSQVETCQEKIISLELEDPKSLESPTTPTTEEFIQAQLQQRLHLSASEDSDDNQSVVTVRGNSDAERLVFNPVDASDYANANVFTKQNLGVIEKTASNLQTIVEVVNPMLCGNGVAKEIAIGRSNDCEFPSYDEARGSDEEDGVVEPICVSRFAYETTENSEEEDAVVYRKKEGGFELSINDKMKNVLKELQLNERVRLSLSRSMDGDEVCIFSVKFRI